MTVTAPPRPNDPLEFQKLEPEADAEALIEEARQRARRRRRISAAAIVGLVALVGVAITVFGRTAESHPTAATDPSGAPSAALQNKVRIDLLDDASHSREFTISGAINDRGTFVDQDGFPTGVRTLFGRSGTIRITVGPQANWEIIKGTKAYAGLHGRGREAGNYFFDTTDITMSGTVSGAPLELQAE